MRVGPAEVADEVLADRLDAAGQPGLELARAKPGFHHPANALPFARLDPALHTPIGHDFDRTVGQQQIDQVILMH